MPTTVLRRGKPAIPIGIAELERKAGEVARFMKLLANENRLAILCRLAPTRELSVNDLADAVGISQSALSQHLAKMREEGLLATRRAAQTVYYRIADPNAERLLSLLKSIYCPDAPPRARQGKGPPKQ
jgi:ArsR family transcriptional regulator, virulence genes transcriptional regulator